ncbi:MAG: NAD(P)/FAD-dependent oxidoreductase [Bdellovibrionales bacterium]|nr:NAD(P)/FAD-dependent oxidoreductase [Bdellovibrionales bacterium]
MNFDVVVIGGGFGGLIAASLLAQEGQKVAVIEQHNKPGGFASHFKRNGYNFEVAVHLLDGPSKNNFRSEIFEFLGIEDNIDFISIPNFFGVHLSSGMVEVPANIPLATQTLMERFPHEKGGIATFFKAMELISDQFVDFLRRDLPIRLSDPLFGVFYPDFKDLSHVTIAEYVYSLVKNNDLRWILMANLGFYYHDLNFPASAYLVNQANYFNGGVRYVRGGVQNIASYLVRHIEEMGGKVFLKSKAEQVLREGSKVSGVQYRKVAGPNREAEVLRSKYVIVNAAIPYFYKHLLNQVEPSNSAIFPKGSSESISATTLYLGLKKPFHELTEASFFNFYREKTPFYFGNSKPQGRDFSLVDYSVVDSSFKKTGKFTADVVFLDRKDHWIKAQQAGLYKEKKENVIQELRNWFYKLNPDFNENIDILELGTPCTVEKFTNNSDGAIYGFNASTMDLDTYCERLRLKFVPDDPNIENLYFASAWSSCQSISGVTVAGYQAARAILEKEGQTLNL